MLSPSPAIENLPGWVLNLALADSLVADVKGQCALGGHRVALALERCREDRVTARDRLGRFADLLFEAHEVVGVLELAVLDVEGVTAEPRAVCGQDTLGLLGLDVDLDGDRVGAVTDVGRDRLGNLRAIR